MVLSSEKLGIHPRVDLTPAGSQASTRWWAINIGRKPASAGANTEQHACARRSDEALN